MLKRLRYARLARKESEHWAKLADLQEQGMSWLHSPTVEAFVNGRISGNGDVNWFGHIVNEHLASREPGPGMSLGCNDGVFDRQIMQAGLCTRFDGYDLSKKAVRRAQEVATKEGLDIRYHECDLNFPEFAHPEDHYALVVAVMSLHHVDHLEELYAKIARAMKPGGLFAINEYIGPNRFQHSDRQLEVLNDLLETLPDRLRKRCHDGKIQKRIKRVREKALIRETPFEAIRSEEILPLLEKDFTIVERKDYGGSILGWLLNYLVPNFDETNDDDRCILSLLCQLDFPWTRPEDGEIPSDFTVIVATPKHGGEA